MGLLMYFQVELNVVSVEQAFTSKIKVTNAMKISYGCPYNNARILLHVQTENLKRTLIM